MRTTIAIDEDLLAELMRVEPGVSRSAAMRRAVVTHVQQKRRQGFLALAGSALVDLSPKDAEQADLKKWRRRGRRR